MREVEPDDALGDAGQLRGRGVTSVQLGSGLRSLLFMQQRRIALALGLSAQTFAHLVLRRNIWKIDFDITSHEIVLEIIATQTNTPIQRSYQTTLGAYEGHLFTSLSINGVHKWFLTRNPEYRTKIAL